MSYGTTSASEADEMPVVDQEISESDDMSTSLTIVHYCNIVNAILIAGAAFGLILTVFKGDTAEAFIAVYLLLFACMLLAFELRLSMYEKQLREDFGFLFTERGRGAFLLFIGLLNFGIPNFEIGDTVGLITVLNACLNSYVLSLNPGWLRQSTTIQPKEADAPYSAVLGLIHWTNIVNAILVGAAASIAFPIIAKNWIFGHEKAQLSDAFLAMYMVFFACLVSRLSTALSHLSLSPVY
jgi:hypothetical protein